MKKLYLRSAVALACALGLSACGGDDKGTWQLSGSVSGVNMAGLVLQNNGGQDLVVEPNVSGFVFPTLIGSDSDYNVTIKSAPTNASCVMVNGKGKSSLYGIGQIAVVCTLKPHNVKGTISGNTTGETTIINGADRVVVAANVSEFTLTKVDATGKIFTGTVGEGQPYGLQVLTPPPGRTCSVANGTGIMGTVDVTNVQVTCI